MVRNLGRFWPDNFVQCDIDGGRSLVCSQLLPNMGWKVLEGFTHMPGFLMLLCEAFFSLHVANWASSQHGLKLAGLPRGSSSLPLSSNCDFCYLLAL